MAATDRRRTSGDDGRKKPQQIADELRGLIVSGQLSEGDSLGHEPDLVAQFGVSRPSLREALRILEAEGFVTVVRGVRGGVVVHAPDEKMTARSAALLLQARNVSLADVFQARNLLEPIAARSIAVSATARDRRSAVKDLRALILEEELAIEDPEAFGVANAAFHQRLVALGGNQTLSIVSEMLTEIVERAVTVESRGHDVVGSIAVRRRGIRSQERLLELIEAGDGSVVEDHWRAHMQVVGRIMLGQKASTVIDLLDHY